jgi:HAD superfamily hydrolase (TIGR01509 family)
MVRAVIFDIDGTLIDSVDLHAQAWQDILLRYGVKTDFQAVRDQIGKGGDKLMRVFLSEQQIARRGKQIESERAKLFRRKYLRQVRPFPGLLDLFERLRKDGIKIALASSAKDDELQVYKKITGIGPYLDAKISSDDVTHSKPDRDIFMAAKQKIGFDARDIIAIGDTRYDAESAGKAGMSTVGLLSGGSTAKTLLAAGCVALYRDLADLLRNYATSPLITRGTNSRSVLGNNERDNNKERSMNSNSALYFLTGLGIGAVAGILYAPKSGSDTRDFLRSKSEEGARYARQTASDAADLAKQKADELKKAATDILDQATKTAKIPVDTVASAIDAGKTAYHEAINATPVR